MIDAKTTRLAAFSLAIAVGYVVSHNVSHSISGLSIGYSHQHDFIGGEHPTDINVTGDDRRVIGRSEAITFSIENNFPSTASVSYSVLLTDENGNELMNEPESPVSLIDRGTKADFSLTVPAYLGEGLYSYQVTAVGYSADRFSDSGIELNFAILDDSIYLMTNEEWHELSLSNGAVPE